MNPVLFVGHGVGAVGRETRGPTNEKKLLCMDKITGSLKGLVAKVGGGLRAVDQLSESWPVGSLEVCAPSVDS